MRPVETIAITGATGFVGKAVLRIAAENGIVLRALTRRPQAPQPGVEWVAGSLEDGAALRALCRGTDAVIHIAGVVNAKDRAGFEAGNVTGTLNIVGAVQDAGQRRFIHVSSLAAREPDLSAYGWSKAKAEMIVKASGLDWTMVRPPAIYGPEDREMLDMFKMANAGWVFLPPTGRMAIIHVDDLARLLLRLAYDDDASIGTTYEVDDGRPGGWTHKEFAWALGKGVGRKVSAVSLPRGLLSAVARADRAIRRDQAKLTPDRVAYFCHEDWTAHAVSHPPADLWRPAISAEEGLAATALWYRQQGWLKR